MRLSIVTTMYCSAAYLEEFYRRALTVAERISEDVEFVFVNDGSPDDSLGRAVELQQRDRRVRVIDLSRNFGHHKAMMTGLAHSTGDLVYLIDCDLEEEPELLEDFHQRLRSTGCDVVYGVQGARKGGLFERITGRVFFFLFNLLSNITLPDNVVTVRLMTRRYVDALVSHRERELLIGGLWVSTGFAQTPVTIQKKSKGSSSYTFARKLNHLVNAITSFSSVPLVYVFYLGLTIVALSLMGAAYLTVNRIFFSVYLSGWPSVMVTVSLLGGLTIFCLGVIGIYLAKVFSEVKQRPYTIVRQIYQSESVPATADAETFARAAADYYAGRLNEHGPTPRGVDWNSREAQETRFAQLLKIRDVEGPFSINDFGCGYGALLDYLRSAGMDARYCGYDASEAMILKAREIHPESAPETFLTGASALPMADYTVASGVFNVRLDASAERWQAYTLAAIDRLARSSARGFAFNVLSSYSDPERMRADLYYANPGFFFDYCKRRYSKWVTLLHDYGLYEFTILVRKGDDDSWLT